MGRLAELVPRPRINLSRFHGVFSPNSKRREYVVPEQPVEQQERQQPRVYYMTWAQRFKRVLYRQPRIDSHGSMGFILPILSTIE
ncbi:MAG: hypothetical protein ACFHX7_08265 [Pseudomonadota bacterium]